MGDWSLPVLGTAYASFLSDINDRLNDSAEMFNSAPSNQPDHTIRLVRSPVKFQEWLTGAWNDLLLDITGGGTGASSASGARTNLGLGTMATQAANSVVITGGTVSGTTLNSTNAIDAAAITSVAGSHVAQSALGTGSSGGGTKFLADNQTYAVPTESHWTVQATQSADFTAALAEKPNLYPLTGSHTVSLPTTAGNAGKRVVLVNFGTGTWTVAANGGDTILGASTLSFGYGQYASITLVCDSNNTCWHIV